MTKPHFLVLMITDFDFSSTFPSTTPQMHVRTDLPHPISPRLFQDGADEEDLATPLTARPIVNSSSNAPAEAGFTGFSNHGLQDDFAASYSSSVSGFGMPHNHLGHSQSLGGAPGHTFGMNMPLHPSQANTGGMHFGLTQQQQPLQHQQGYPQHQNHSHGHVHSQSFAGPGLSMSMINPPKLFGQEHGLPMHPGQGFLNQPLPFQPQDQHSQHLQQPGSQIQSSVPSSALWPGSASLPNLNHLAGSGMSFSLPGSSSGNMTGKKAGKAGDTRPKKRARCSEGSDEEGQQVAAGSTSGSPKEKEKKVGKDKESKLEQGGDLDNEVDEDSDAEGTELGEINDEVGLNESGMMGMSSSMTSSAGFVPGMLGLRDGSVLEVGADGMSPGSTGSGFAKDGSAAAGGGDADDVSVSDQKDGKFRLKGGLTVPLGKKKKVPPPGGFKPWNTSPSSSHLPSGSACINPVTGEVELPPMDNLTKEEIRKVKNRASAQRSRTRKGELLGGLMDEVNRLRERLRDVTNGAEGGDGDDASMGAEEFLRKTHAARAARGGSVMSSTGSIGRDEEKEGMKMLIERLRAEVENERKAREAAEAQGWMWKNKHDQLISSIALGAGETINPGLVSDPPASVRNAKSEEDMDKTTLGLPDLDKMGGDDDEDEDRQDADEDQLMELSSAGHLDAAAPAKAHRAQLETVSESEDGGRDLVQAKKREKAVIKGTQRDSKGVLMMVSVVRELVSGPILTLLGVCSRSSSSLSRSSRYRRTCGRPGSTRQRLST